MMKIEKYVFWVKMGSRFGPLLIQFICVYGIKWIKRGSRNESKIGSKLGQK